MQNHHKIHKNPPKIGEIWGLDWSPGDSWGGLGSHFGSQGLLGTAKNGQMAEMCPKNGSPFGGPFSTFFDICWYIFALCFRDSVLVAILQDFHWIWESFWSHFSNFFEDPGNVLGEVLAAVPASPSTIWRHPFSHFFASFFAPLSRPLFFSLFPQFWPPFWLPSWSQNRKKL